MASAAVIAEHVVRPSGPAVRPFVDSYVGYHYAGFEPGVHVGMPSRRLTFVVSLADPLDVRMPGESAGTGYDAVVSGLHPAPAAVAHDGTQIGIELPLRLDAARALFGRPAAELAGVAVRLRDLWGHVADELLDRLASAADWSSRFAVLDDILPRVLARFDDPAGRPGAAAVQTWQLLTDTDGSRPIGAVADELGWSRRHLAQMFTAEYGVAPKTMSRIMRFDRSVPAGACRRAPAHRRGSDLRLRRPGAHESRMARPGRVGAEGVAGRRTSPNRPRPARRRRTRLSP